jgi:hypothetical protein
VIQAHGHSGSNQKSATDFSAAFSGIGQSSHGESETVKTPLKYNRSRRKPVPILQGQPTTL